MLCARLCVALCFYTWCSHVIVLPAPYCFATHCAGRVRVYESVCCGCVHPSGRGLYMSCWVRPGFGQEVYLRFVLAFNLGKFVTCHAGVCGVLLKR